MIVDVVIFIGIFATIALLISIERQSVAIAALSLLFWIFMLALSMVIEIPYQAATEYPVGTGIMNITTGSQLYYEPGLTAIIFGVLIFNIIWLIVLFSNYKQSNRYGGF